MRYAKAVVAAISSVLTVATAVLADNLVNADELGQLLSALVVAGAGVVAVYRTPNAE